MPRVKQTETEEKDRKARAKTLKQRIEEELLKMGIHNAKELEAAIAKQDPLDIGIFVSPVSGKEGNVHTA